MGEPQVAAAGRSQTTGLVVVTGAGSGIGQAIALRFARSGAEVIVSDIDEAAAEATVTMIAGQGGKAYAYKLDVSNPDAWESFASGVRDDHGVPDVLVNNAGILISGSFLDHDAADWERIVGVNLMGVVHGSRVVGQQMVERGEGGHIVNIASTAAFLPMRGGPAYSVTKAGVLMLSECLRIDFAAHGIGVTAICPTVIRSNISRHGHVAGDVDAETEARFAEIGAALQDRIAWAGPDKVARVVSRSVRRNPAIVPVNPDAWVIYFLRRLSPALVRGIARLASFDVTRRGAEWLYPRLIKQQPVQERADRPVDAPAAGG